MSRINQLMATVQTPGNYLVENSENYFDNSTTKQSRKVRLFCKHLTRGDKLNSPPAGEVYIFLLAKDRRKVAPRLEEMTMTDAAHIQIEEEHVVMFNDLRVLISGDDQRGWFAQGIEIDYYACGDTLEVVQSNFANGFQLTLEEHLSRYGDIERFLRWAPFDETMKLMDSTRYNFSSITQ